MVELNTKIKTAIMNKKVVITTYLPKGDMCKSVKVKDEDFYELENLSGEKYLLNKKDTITIRYRPIKEHYLVVHRFLYNTKGLVVSVDESFILLELITNKTNKKYEKLIPIKEIKNIKTFYEDEEAIEDDED